MPTTIGSKGAELNLLIRQGGTFGPYPLTLTDPTTLEPLNLTGCTFRAQVRKSYSDLIGPTAAADFTIIDANTGQLEWSISESQTSALTAGVDENASASAYIWDMEMSDSLGRVIPLLYGDVKVFREVPKGA